MEKYLTIGAILAFLLAMLCVYCCKHQTEHDQKYKNSPNKTGGNNLI